MSTATEYAPSAEEINRLEKAAWDANVDHVLVWERDRQNNLGYFVKGWLDLEIEDASRRSKDEIVDSLIGLRDQVLQRLGAK